MLLAAHYITALVVTQLVSQASGYENSLTHTVCTPALSWPSDAKQYLSWLDKELTGATGARRANILAARGYFLRCRLDPDGRKDLRTAISIAPDDPRIICFCIVDGEIDVSGAILKVQQDETWKASYFVAKLLAEGDINVIATRELPDSDEPVIKLLRGYQLYLKRDLQQAEQIVRGYLSQWKSGPLCTPELPHVILSMILRGTGKSEEAKTVLAEGLLLNPISKAGLLQMVQLLCESDDRVEALEIAKLLGRRFPDAETSNRALAQALYYNREFKRAILYYDRIFDTIKEEPYTISEAADCYLKARMPGRASALLHRFISKLPDHPASDSFAFRAAICDLLDSPDAERIKKGNIELVVRGIKLGTSTKFDQLLGVGAIANQGHFETADKLLKELESQKLDASFDKLKDALRASVDMKQPFRF